MLHFELGRWHGEGTSNWVPIISQGDRVNYQGSTYSIEDGSYFRIRNLQLGYSFQQKVISKIRLKGLRIYANAQKLSNMEKIIQDTQPSLAEMLQLSGTTQQVVQFLWL